MTQEDLAFKLNVSRQTVSKWELGDAFPEVDKLIALSELFSCSLDDLIRSDINDRNDAYSEVKEVELDEFRYIRYPVISIEPESDAIKHVNEWAKFLNISEPNIIGWDFPFVSQEQTNVFNMHGYTAALILDEKVKISDERFDIVVQPKVKYVSITIKDPFKAPFTLIPNAFNVLKSFMHINGLQINKDNEITNFERQYVVDGISYMDIYIAIK